MANVQMTKVQMWNRYKALKKKDYNWTCICPVCSKQIYEKDPDIEYVKTKRGTEIFIHTQCIKEWDKQVVEGCSIKDILKPKEKQQLKNLRIRPGSRLMSR